MADVDATVHFNAVAQSHAQPHAQTDSQTDAQIKTQADAQPDRRDAESDPLASDAESELAQLIRPTLTEEPTEPNEAIEVVGGKVETVEVSKHPTPSIPETDLSLAEIERRRSHPVRWIVVILAALTAMIAPYWFGRSLAVNDTYAVLGALGGVSAQGIALIGWTAVVIAYVGLAMAVVVSPSWPWLIVFVIGLAGEQFIAGLSMLNLNFWYSTYVVYGDQANLANAANIGIMAAAIGIAVYAVIFVGLLVVIKKTSPLNVLTKSWASFILYFAIEALALFVVLFGGVLTVL
ncbi:teichoic acid transporter [Bifidobacterium sp. DSM 109959]|uniref:Teichoic acid transporter n=1 Tax=Bifidobacterium olomucense TaxID=2675324 RepID=A0A7Y0EYZ1_9BIFI|nr:teichoic acid transporter [Bifidobacterium sp. DSM 109959]